MVFVINDEGMVIAADQAFMDYSDIKSIYLLAEEFRAGNFLFFDKRGEYHFRGKTSRFSKTPVKTILGDGNLYQVHTQEQVEDTHEQGDTFGKDKLIPLTEGYEMIDSNSGDDRYYRSDDAAPTDTGSHTKGSGDDNGVASTPFADYGANARLMGITTRDYQGFLERFVDEVAASESDLRGEDRDSFRDSTDSLRDTAQLLNLSLLATDIEKIRNAPSDEKDPLLDTFFQNIRHIYDDIKSNTATTLHYAEGDQRSKPRVFSLHDVEVIPFDYSAKNVADELGLPEALIDEFVSDFVHQATEEAPTFYKAYQNRDMQTIQKSADMLKDVAGNLRMDPVAETLDALRENDDPEKAGELLRKFLGQLKGLESFTKISNIFKG